MPGERRRYKPREKVFLLASLHALDGTKLADCEVVDLSSTGARLHVTGDPKLPAKFMLDVRRRKVSYCCSVVHRPGKDLFGVKFDLSQRNVAGLRRRAAI